METLTLSGLLENLEKQAGLEKSASEKTENAEKKDEKDAEAKDMAACKAVDAAAKDVKDAEGKNGKEKTEDAHEKGAALAKEVIEKVAQLQLDQVKPEDNMNKQAADAGKALAQALLEKLANVGDMNTENGIAPGSVPNKTQQDLAAQEAEQTAIIQPMPGTDGRGQGGTVNQIFDAIVAKAMAQGAAPMDQNPAPGVAKDEGVQVGAQAPNQVQTGSFTIPGEQTKMASDEHEKAAAVSALVAEGLDFDQAVNLVKEAAEEIDREEVSQVKQAALAHLIDNGMDFDSAVNLVKKAGLTKEAGIVSSIAGKGASLVEKVVASPVAGKTVKSLGPTVGKVVKTVSDNPLKSALGAGVIGGATVASAMSGSKDQVKQAAVSLLLNIGVDFDQAVDLVNAEAKNLYR